MAVREMEVCALMRITDLLALSHVPRWSIVDHVRRQSVAEHTFNTLVIYMELCDRLGVPLSLQGLTWVITHDGPEARTGDIPASFKPALNGDLPGAERAVCPWLPPPPEGMEYLLFKLADKLEALLFIRRYGIGTHAARVAECQYQSLMESAAELPDVLLAVDQLFAELSRDEDR